VAFPSTIARRLPILSTVASAVNNPARTGAMKRVLISAAALKRPASATRVTTA
jgi:hypothetical protein